jgi:hypothetical protein
MHTSILYSLLTLVLSLCKWVSFRIYDVQCVEKSRPISHHIWRCHITHWLHPGARVCSAVALHTRQCSELNRARPEPAEPVQAGDLFFCYVTHSLHPRSHLPLPSQSLNVKMASGLHRTFKRASGLSSLKKKPWQDRRYECLIIKFYEAWQTIMYLKSLILMKLHFDHILCRHFQSTN